MENILHGIRHVEVYLDDMIVTGTTNAQHPETLDLVLGRMEEARFQLKRKKCTFLVDEVVYLGHRIDQHGILPVQDKMEAILKARSPENVQELQAFVGLLNCYGTFLYKLSTVLAPLHILLCMGKKMVVGNVTTAGFPKSEGTPINGSDSAL